MGVIVVTASHKRAQHRLHWTKGIRPLPKLNLHFGLYLVSGIIPARPLPVKPTVRPLMAKKFQEIEPGHEITIHPDKNDLFFACCDCNLVHQMQFKIDGDNVIIQFWRHKRKTGALRRHRGIPIVARRISTPPSDCDGCEQKNYGECQYCEFNTH